LRFLQEALNNTVVGTSSEKKSGERKKTSGKKTSKSSTNHQITGPWTGERTWKQAIPHIAALHRGGKLVPFTGSGMSRPVCADWTSFISRLCVVTGVSKNALSPNTHSEELLRRADDAMRVLRGWMPNRRRDEISKALSPSKEALDVPPQSKALAEFRWPLVITTNYEDVFLEAVSLPSWNKDTYDIRGRTLQDCHAVLRSLDWPSSPILWTIQGFIGGPFMPVGDAMPDERRQESLLAEIVISHRQYQEAAYLNPHFRRAFSEVFRRRALLFLGSGITESYLAGLFAETLMMQGQRAGSHFALLPSHEANDVHRRFLSDRLGILAYTYDHYEEVVEFLTSLLASTKHFMPARFKAHLEPSDSAVEISSIGYRVARAGGTETVVILDHRDLIDDVERQRVLWAISVGRHRGRSSDILYHGEMSQVVLKRLELFETGFPRQPIHGYLYRHKEDPRLVAVAARPQEAQSDSPLDPRALSEIRAAMLALLRYATAESGVDAVRVGLLSAGPSAPWNPIFPLVMMLAAIRDFSREAQRRLQVEITVVDSRAWTRVVSGELPVHEILSAARLPILVQIDSELDSADTIVYMAEDGSTLSEVLEHLNLQAKDWMWTIVPASSTSRSLLSEPDKVLLIPYSTIILHPRREPAE
jgi:hypothetical protein